MNMENKQVYKKPIMEEVRMETMQMIAASARMRDDRDVDYSDDQSSEGRGSWGNLWE